MTIPEGFRRMRLEEELAWAGVRMLVALAAFYTAFRGVLLFEDRLHITRGIVYIIVAVVMLIAATWRAPALSTDNDEDATAAPSDDAREGADRWALIRRLVPSWGALAWWGLLVAAIGLGFAFRLYLIASQPFGVWFDEAQNGLVAQQILDDSGFRPVFIGGLTQLPALFFYVFAAAIQVLGQGVTALRSVTTAAGILTVILLYLLARELFDHRVAVLATFFLAVMRWHVNFSRFAAHGVFAPLFMVATFYFLVRGLKGKGSWNFVVAGIMAGVGLQGYFSFLLVPFIIAPFLLHHAIFGRVLPWRKLALGVAAFGIATVAVYAPVGVWALRNQDQFNQRTDTLTITTGRSASEVADVVYESTKQHLLMFNSAGDRNGRHNLPGAPMLDTYTGFLFILGAGYALWRVRDPGHFLMLVWVAVTLQGGIWSVDFEAPQAYRTQGVTPAVAMLAAIPLGLLWRLATDRTRSMKLAKNASSSRYAAYSLAGAAALVTIFSLAQAGRLNFDTYFNQQLTRSDAWAAYSADATIVAREMKSLGTDPNYLLSTLLLGQPTLVFENPDYQASNVSGFDWARDIPASGDSPAVYLLDATKEPFYLWLQELYPEARFQAFTPPDVPDPVVVYEAVIPADVVQALHGLEATYTPVGGSAISNREAALDLDWSGGAPAALPLDAVWSGFLKVTEYRDYQLTLEAPGSLRLFLDDELLAEGDDRIEVTRRLYKGEHELRVEAGIERPGRVLLSWDGAPVPADAYFAYEQGGHGLVGTFYPNDNWEGEPILQQLDPLVGFRYHAELPFAAPFSTIWEGFLDVQVSGDYALLLDARDSARLLIDGAEVLSTPYTLTEGRHTIEVRYLSLGGFPNIFVYWTPPGGEREIIPPSFLSPR